MSAMPYQRYSTDDARASRGRRQHAPRAGAHEGGDDPERVWPIEQRRGCWRRWPRSLRVMPPEELDRNLTKVTDLILYGRALQRVRDRVHNHASLVGQVEKDVVALLGKPP